MQFRYPRSPRKRPVNVPHLVDVFNEINAVTIEDKQNRDQIVKLLTCRSVRILFHALKRCHKHLPNAARINDSRNLP
jgi:hypothetical protein